MAKNILAFLGMLFLVVLIGGSVLLMGNIYDSIGLVSLPDKLAKAPQELLKSMTSDEVKITTSGTGKVEWNNPLEILPKATATFLPTPTDIPMPTATPIPPLSQSEYRGQVMANLKAFASGVERWLDSNDQLTEDENLMNDPNWREEALTSLDQVAASAQVLAQVGPPPPEYDGIDALLDQTSAQAESLAQNYRLGVQNGDVEYLSAAGDDFNQMKDTLTQAVEQMLAAGWSVE